MRRIIVRKNNRGESLAETLVALLIAAFALLILAGMVQSSSNLITKSEKHIKDYVEAENSLVDETAAKGIDGKAYLSTTISGSEKAVYLNNRGDTQINVYYYTAPMNSIDIISIARLTTGD
ncbi:MAG: hypothetical protein IJI92_04610 [Erysipelotrichaceae bacterium]|nr:hypothetical protein [Erysipelotrichaceae bacterium]